MCVCVSVCTMLSELSECKCVCVYVCECVVCTDQQCVSV